jgi:hypothetical protein
MTEKLKLCGECKKEKHLETDFHKDKSTKDGRHWRCKVYKNEYSRQHNKLKKDFEKLAEYHGISKYPTVDRRREEFRGPDISCDVCNKEVNTGILCWRAEPEARRGAIIKVCRECIAKNKDDIAHSTYTTG